MTALSDDAKAADYTEFFSRHLVGLNWYEGPVNARGEFTRRPDFRCASGFLLQVYGIFCLVTAGHVLTDYDDRKKKGLVGKHQSLLDVWSPRARFKEPIPFDFTDAPALVKYEPQSGLDFAVIGLPNIIQQALLQTIEPFTHERWLFQNNLSFDFYALLGLPTVDATQETGAEGKVNWLKTISYSRVILIEQSLNPPSDLQKTEFPQFVGTIHPNETISDIVGTSGGPIFGFRKCPDRKLQYWPVAIQSRWLDRSRIVIGTSIPIVAHWVHEWIRQFAAEVDDHGGQQTGINRSI